MLRRSTGPASSSARSGRRAPRPSRQPWEARRGSGCRTRPPRRRSPPSVPSPHTCGGLSLAASAIARSCRSRTSCQRHAMRMPSAGLGSAARLRKTPPVRARVEGAHDHTLASADREDPGAANCFAPRGTAPQRSRDRAARCGNSPTLRPRRRPFRRDPAPSRARRPALLGDDREHNVPVQSRGIRRVRCRQSSTAKWTLSNWLDHCSSAKGADGKGDLSKAQCGSHTWSV